MGRKCGFNLYTMGHRRHRRTLDSTKGHRRGPKGTTGYQRTLADTKGHRGHHRALEDSRGHHRIPEGTR